MSKFDLRLAARFSKIQQDPDAALQSDSETDQIVAALLHDRIDWYPSAEMTALDALNRLAVEGDEWVPTLQAVQARGRIKHYLGYEDEERF